MVLLGLKDSVAAESRRPAGLQADGGVRDRRILPKMTEGSGRRRRRTPIGLAVALTISISAGACSASPTPGPTASPSPTAAQTASATASPSVGPISSLPAGCPEDASGTATGPRVSIADVEAQGYPDYDVLAFDFDRGLPTYAITSAVPPFTRDPSGLPLTVEGKAFFSVVLQGASIVDEEFQPVYEGSTDFKPDLARIKHVVLAGDFEAVSTWIVGLAAPACLAVQAFPPDRLVIGFFGAP